MTFWNRVRSWMRSTVHRSRMEGEIDAELRFHLDAYTQDLIRGGVPREEAFRRARLEFGAIEGSKEECREARGVRLTENLWQDLRYGARMLRKNPGFTTVAILTLALGIGLNTAMFSILDAVLLRPLPYQNADRLVKVEGYEITSGSILGTASYPDFADWRENNPFLASVSAYEEKTFNLVGSINPEHVRGQVVSHELFETLGVQPGIGRTLATFERQQAVVLSHGFWARSFDSNPLIVGESITLDRDSYQVVGVAPPGFQFPNPETDLWLSINPSRPDFREEMSKRGNLGFFVVGRLKPNVAISQAQTGMETIGRRLALQYPDADRDLGIRLVPLREDIAGKFRPTLVILMGSVVVVLLIACANIGNLLLARSQSRRAEISLRASLGATRQRLIAQLVTESLLLATAGGALGAILAYSLMGALVSWAPKDIPRLSAVHVDAATLCFTFLISAFAGLCFGLAPSWQLSRRNLNDLIKENGRGSAERSRVTKLIVACEIALSLVLLAAAGLLTKSLVLLERVDPGFRADHLLTVEVYRSISGDMTPAGLWANWTGFFQQVLTRIEAVPGVESAGATIALPIQGLGWRSTFTIDGRTFRGLSDQPQADARIVSNNYFDVMKIPLRTGRSFSEHDSRESPHVAVINETVSQRYWPGENPVGRFIDMPAFGAGRCKIVGVVADIHQANLNEDPSPGIYVPYTQEPMPWQTLVIRTKIDPISLVPAVRREVSILDPQQPLARIATLDQLVEASTAQPRFRAVLLGSFAAVSLLLAAVGIFGVMSYAVSQRTREIGVRIALGAQRTALMRLILGEAAKIAIAGVIAGFALSFAFTRFMRGLLFGVSGTDPATFLGVALLLVAVALAACYVPARRAMRVDPMTALRYE
jgi:putative ABC transport system permease protein